MKLVVDTSVIIAVLAVVIRKDDQLYILMPASKNVSPLDVKGIDIEITPQDIVQFIHESRKS
jgi:hypothetical protein